jgi:undecaprenyl-diphosphatase
MDRMIEWIEALTLGLVQGLTEFLPVSSDGHLNITEYLFSLLRGKTRESSENLFFYVILHLGTLTAVAIYYRAVVKTATKGLLGSTEVPPEYRRDALIRVGVLAFIATLPLVPLKLFFMKYIEKAFEGTVGTGIGFLITAAILLLTLALDKGKPGKGPSTTTWLDALLIGIAQMFAPLPGVSRSGLTVAAALSLGLSRSWAVGFSLLIMVPAVLGATLSDLKDFDRSTFTPDRIQQTIAATIVAGVIGYGAIIWLVKIVRSGKLWYFSVYLIVIGLAILSAAFLGKPTDARPTSTPDRSVRSGASGPVDRAPESGGHRPVARPDAFGARPGRAGVGSTVQDGRGDPRLVLV